MTEVRFLPTAAKFLKKLKDKKLKHLFQEAVDNIRKDYCSHHGRHQRKFLRTVETLYEK